MSADFGELLNIKVPAGSRTLYVDLKKGADGSHYVSISEVGRAGAERSRILVDEEFAGALHCALGAVVELLKRMPPAAAVQGQSNELARSYKPWTAQEEQQLKDAYSRGRGVDQLARQHQRAATAVLSRLYQLGMVKMGESPRWE